MLTSPGFSAPGGVPQVMAEFGGQDTQPDLVRFFGLGICVESTTIGGLINYIFVALAYCNDQHNQSAIQNLIDEPIADTA